MSVQHWKQPAGPKGEQPNRVIQVVLFGTGDIIVAGTDLALLRINSLFEGWIIQEIEACVFAASDSSALTVQVRNNTGYMLSTSITLASGETDTSVAATPPVISNTNKTVHEADQIMFDVLTAGSNAYGLNIEVTLAES